MMKRRPEVVSTSEEKASAMQHHSNNRAQALPHATPCSFRSRETTRYPQKGAGGINTRAWSLASRAAISTLTSQRSLAQSGVWGLLRALLYGPTDHNTLSCRTC